MFSLLRKIHQNNKQKKARRTPNPREQGDAVINTILAISIIAIMGILSLKGYSYAMDKIRSGEAVTMIQQIAQGVQELFSNNRDFTGINTATAIKSGVVHKSNVSGEKILSPWYSSDQNSVVTIKEGARPSQFIIEMDRIPAGACAKIGGAFLGEAAAVSANGTASKTPVELSTNCATANPAKLSVSF